ncbi:MAG: GNAT family N-acetyltransferase [Xanthomonadales bacterium]|nr:GNAT family N-acetyltransferase [Xanthomonadales bacterium]
MSETITKNCELDLLALLEPFKTSADPGGERQNEASALLAFVDNVLDTGQEKHISRKRWHDYLDTTRRPDFLGALTSPEARMQWADHMFRIVDFSEYGLRDMLEQRVEEQPQHALFRETDNGHTQWTYQQVFSYMKKIAAVFYSAAEQPRVLLYLENSPEGACADLACLTFGILDSPVDRHFDRDTIAYIVKRLSINIVVTDNEARLHRLIEVQKQTGIPLKIFVTDPQNRVLRSTDLYLGEACSQLSATEADEILDRQPERDQHAVNTVMFTSGSTGEPKGLAFTNYNLVTKRFARAAALPEVGHDEVLFCYLPLFHTFGRYLEMLGMVFWGGTYVFAGNTSRETFLKRLAEVQPTGLIGIPLRWRQIQEFCLEQLDPAASPEVEQGVFRSVVGKRLRWGISAAGFLAPKTFRFFHRNHVALCCGFGMTEATGGITMTPPHAYRDHSVGIPLPGMATRLTDRGELEIGGPYMARYLEQLDCDDPGIAVFNARTDVPWMKTGDLFQIGKDGHYEIVDRLKDIYKNNRGQTVAPRRVEQKFNDVPGIKNVFLVGDGRDYNVLLIVPDTDEQLLSITSEDQQRERYFKNIVTAANQELMPYERVVNIALLDRDFDIDKGELTPKGSFRRKQVVENFKTVIDELYVRDFVEFSCPGLNIRVPRWFFRDLGILEADDIECTANGLHDISRNLHLPISIAGSNVLVGDLEYELEDDVLDLGLFARQPLLWAGNPALLAFCPCKEGWDAQLKGVATHVSLPYRKEGELKTAENSSKTISNQQLKRAHQVFTKAFFGAETESMAAIDQLETMLAESEDRLAELIRSRLQALARHPVENIRCQAYSVMLLNRPMPDYRSVYPAFLNSGLSFLNDEFIHRIGHRKIERRRLEALRLRMLHYRTRLTWPVTPVVVDQIGKLLQLMADFVKTNPQFYYAIRGELASWVVHQTDPELMRKAESLLIDLSEWYEIDLGGKIELYEPSDWSDRMVFEQGVTEYEIGRLSEAFVQTTFLYKSIALAFDVHNFDLMNVPIGGIWFSRLLSQRGHHVYRVSVNTVEGDHYELMVTVREDYSTSPTRKVLCWLMAISDHPHGPDTLPRLGCSRADLGVLSLAFVNDLTVWERIREFNSSRRDIFVRQRQDILSKLFIRAMSAFFATCRNSGYQIVPGYPSPTNVVVLEPDYRQGATILSLGGWHDYDGPLSIVRPLVKNFFKQTTMHYPWAADMLDQCWVFDACVEALGIDEGQEFLRKLETDLLLQQTADEKTLSLKLTAYLAEVSSVYYVPVPLRCAIERYKEWDEVNPGATPQAKEKQIDTLFNLYTIKRFGDIARYHMYRHTYFADAKPEICMAFDYLMTVLHENPGLPAISSPALSELQATLQDKGDRHVFGHLVFPRAHEVPDLEVLAIGDRSIKQVVVKSQIAAQDGTHYYVREATEPSEIGQLYRLFLNQRFQKTVSEFDRFLIVVDNLDRLVGGVCFEIESDKVVYLDGVVIARQLQGGGIGGALLEDFCMRLSNYGFEVVRTHFYRRGFYLKRSFQTDKRWGGLVRFLVNPPGETPGL